MGMTKPKPNLKTKKNGSVIPPNRKYVEMVLYLFTHGMILLFIISIFFNKSVVMSLRRVRRVYGRTPGFYDTIRKTYLIRLTHQILVFNML